jgi:hypothetical protein
MAELPGAPRDRSRSCAHLQALDDAIRYRSARLQAPCRKWRPGVLCHDHACDLNLLGACHRMAQAAVAELQHAPQASATSPRSRAPW